MPLPAILTDVVAPWSAKALSILPAMRKNKICLIAKPPHELVNFRELNGGFPGAILADEIMQPGDDQIRALFVTGGNPLMTMANSERLKSALQQLELLVVTDIYLNETASLAHYVLPATSPLERPDLPFIFPLFLGMQSKPYMTATEAVIDAQDEQRDEATIYTDLARASGVSLFGSKFVQRALGALRFCNGLFKSSKQPSLPLRLILDGLLRFNNAGTFKKGRCCQ